MTSEELLTPRFEVIADFPNNPHEVGTILTISITDYYEFEKDGRKYTTNVKNIENYPYLYKELKWFEQRKKEDMPKRLICKAFKGDTDISEIEEWDMEIMVGWINKEKRVCCSLLSFNYEYGYFPVD